MPSDRDAEARADDKRDGRVDAPDLDRHRGERLAAEMLLELPEGGDRLLAARQLLNQHGRRAHHGGRDDQRLVRDVGRVDQVDRQPFVQAALHHETADIGIATAAGAEEGGADREVVEVFGGELHGGLNPSPGRRPP